MKPPIPIHLFVALHTATALAQAIPRSPKSHVYNQPAIIAPRNDQREPPSSRNLTFECEESYYAVQFGVADAVSLLSQSASSLTPALYTYLATRTTAPFTSAAPALFRHGPTQEPAPAELSSLCAFITAFSAHRLTGVSPPAPTLSAAYYDGFVADLQSAREHWASVGRSVGAACTEAAPPFGYRLLMDYAEDEETCSSAYLKVVEAFSELSTSMTPRTLSPGWSPTVMGPVETGTEAGDGESSRPAVTGSPTGTAGPDEESGLSAQTSTSSAEGITSPGLGATGFLVFAALTAALAVGI